MTGGYDCLIFVDFPPPALLVLPYLFLLICFFSFVVVCNIFIEKRSRMECAVAKGFGMAAGLFRDRGLLRLMWTVLQSFACKEVARGMGIA